MKILNTLFLITLITTYSCSNDTDETMTELPMQGNISLALSNGGGFVVENIVATVTKPYGSGNTSTITITGTAGGSGKLKITLVDNDDSSKAFAQDISIPLGSTTEPAYATIEYESDNFNLDASAGTVKINRYIETSGQKYTELNATFSATGSNFNTMTSSISGLILSCSGC